MMNMLHLKDDLEQISLALRWINSPPNRNPPLVKRAEKNRIKAELLRKEGNKKYVMQMYKDALKLYTNSVSMAHMDSLELHLALGNKSATFFQLKMYEECLADIEIVLAKKCSITLKEKLLKRKKEALELLPTQIKTPYYADLQTIAEEERNPKIPSASNAITINQNMQFGRHIVAQRDIKVGEVLIVEKPIGHVVDEEKEFHCSECLELCYNLIPCEYCSLALYCNEACKETAFARYHQFECPIGESLSKFGEKVVLSARIAFITRDEWNIADLDGYSSSTPTEPFKSDRYKELHGLVTHESCLPNEQICKQSQLAASVFWLVQKGTNFFQTYDASQFKRVILRLIRIMPYNIVTQHELGFNVFEDKFTKDSFATCIYPVCALLNHSCSANLASYSCGNTMIVYSVARIKKDEQCFISYEIDHGIYTRERRQQELSKKFLFTCTCIACKEDWPLMEQLPYLQTLPAWNDSTTQLAMVDRDPKIMEKVKLRCIQFLEESGHHMPSFNVFLARAELAFSFNGLGNIKRPLRKYEILNFNLKI